MQNFYMVLLSFVMLLLNSVCSLAFSKHDILMSALASIKIPLKIYNSRDVSCHVYHFMGMLTEATAEWELKKA